MMTTTTATTRAATAMTATGSSASTGGRLVSEDGRLLPLLGARLTASARGGVARAVLEQRFANPHPDPLRVTYLFPLPHDGAVSGFAFRVGDRRIAGEVDRREAARERFEEAIASGRTAALVDQERGSLFTQELGNVPPGAEIVAELTVDQRLAWLPSGAWEWRFPTAVAPRYQGAEGRVADAARTRVDVADAPLPARLALALRIEDALAAGTAPESPSHAVACRPSGGALDVGLAAGGGVPLDRDVVLRWSVAAPGVGVSLETSRAAAGPLAPAAYGLVTLVPPSRDARGASFARDLVVLLDTSGSMAGEPLAQARRVVSALVDGLRDGDTLELVEFSDAPRRWRPEPTRATAAARADALAWLAALEAGGSTELRTAIVEALRGLRPGAQRQVLLVTDGLIGFEDEIVREILDGLPASSRLHTLGVGSAVNRSLLGPAARAGRGTESIVGLGEDAERAVRTVVAHMEAPLVTGLELGGDAVAEVAPARLPDLFGGAPALVPVRLRPEGGELRVSGDVPGGRFERTLRVAPVEPGTGRAAVAALFGREAVEDLEARIAAGVPAESLERSIERLGLDHQISTRLTSWVAVSEEPSVDPTQPTRHVRVPQQLPHGLSVEGLGLRSAGAPLLCSIAAAPAAFASPRTRFVAKMAETCVYGEAPPEAPARQPRPALSGRILLRRGRLLVITAAVSDDVSWQPPAQAEVYAAGGSGPVTLAVNPARTTAAGLLRPGQLLRLALELPEGVEVPEDLARVVLAVDGEELEIELEAASPGPRRGRSR